MTKKLSHEAFYSISLRCALIDLCSDGNTDAALVAVTWRNDDQEVG